MIGDFPDIALMIRLAGLILKEIVDDWRASRKYFQQESLELLNDWKKPLKKEPTSFISAITSDLSLESQSNLDH